MKLGHIKKKLLVALTGTALAQVIHLLFTPILTRIYTPEEFGVVALLISLLGLSSAFATGRLEAPIVFAENQEKSVLYKIIKIITNYITLLVLITSVVLFLLGESKYSIVFLFLSIATYLRSKYMSYRNLLNSKGKYKDIASGKILENSFNGISAYLLAFTPVGYIGLLVGKSLSFLPPLLLYKKKEEFEEIDNSISTKEVFSKYKEFPKYSIVTTLVTQININLTIFAFLSLFGQETVGHLSMTTRVLSLPINIIGLVFLDVFREKATHDFKEQGNCTNIFIKFLLTLLSLAICIFVIINFFGVELFTFVLGDKWEIAGKFSTIIVALYALRLVASPLSFTLQLNNGLKLDLIYKTIQLALATTVIGLSYNNQYDAETTLKYYTIVCATVVLASIYSSYLYSKK